MSTKAALAVLAALCMCSWAQAKLHGVSYEPFSPGKDICLGKKRVASDLKAIAKIAKSIRLKSVGTCGQTTEQVLEFAKKNKMTVMLGLYISDSEKDNTSELKMLRRMLEKFGGKVISHVVVGDEITTNFDKVSEMDVARFINRAKARVKKLGMKIPVGTAEAWNLLEFNKKTAPIIKASDFLCMNMQPYWGGWNPRCGNASCQRLGQLVNSKAEVLAQKFGKTVVICNTGWPSMGEECCGIDRKGSLDGFQAVPSVNNLQSLLTEVHEEATAAGRAYYIGDAIDGEWKRSHAPCTDCLGLSTEFGCGAKKKKNRECEVGYHMGLFTVKRKLKEISIP